MPNPERFFDLTPDGPDWAAYYFWATLCRLTYFNSPELKSQAAQVAGPGIVLHAGAAIPAFPAIDVYGWDGCMGVVIQGTQGYQQYLFQALGANQVNASPWPGLVSLFWTAVAAELWPMIDQAAAVLQPRRLLFSGHSYGGAVAQLLGYQARQRFGLDFRGVVSIGSPAVGNAAFCTAMTWPHWRLVNEGDPVPYLPPAANFCVPGFPPPGLFTSYAAYDHFGRGFLLQANGAALAGQTAQAAFGINGNPLVLVANSTSWINSHHSGEYARRLRLQLPQELREPARISELFGRLDNLQLTMNGLDGRTW